MHLPIDQTNLSGAEFFTAFLIRIANIRLINLFCNRDRSYGKADLQKFLSTQIDNARLKQRLYHQKRIQQNARLLREERPHHQARLRNEARSNNEALRYNAAPVLRDVRKLDSDS